jgi:heme-degrading monooxygenase HmoA
MYAQVARFQLPVERLDAFVRDTQERVFPLLQRQAGFKNAYVLVDRQGGTAVAASLWESEAARRQGEQAIAEVRTAQSQQFGEPPTVAGYEVAVAEGSGGQARAVRVTVLRHPPERTDHIIQLYRELVVPRLQEHPPIRGLRLLVDRASGQSLAIALWESAEAMAATEEIARGQRDRAQQASGAEFTSVERYEVAAQG